MKTPLHDSNGERERGCFMPITLLIMLPLRHTELLRVRGWVLPECAWIKRCWKSSASFHRVQKHAGGLFNKSRYSQLLIVFPSWMQYLSFTVAVCLGFENSFTCPYLCFKLNKNWAQICIYCADVSPKQPTDIVSMSFFMYCCSWNQHSCKAATGKSTCLPAEIMYVCFSEKSHLWLLA